MPAKNEFDSREASRRFIEIRTKEHLTQEELANRLGVALQTVKNYEKAGSANVRDSSNSDRTNAIRGMKLETLFNMANRFNVSSDYLLGISDVPIINPDMRNAMEFTGLTQESINMIKTLHRHPNSVHLIRILNWLLSNPSFTRTLIIRMHNYEIESQAYFKTNNSLNRDSSELEKAFYQVEKFGEPSEIADRFFNFLSDLDTIEDSKDLILFRVNKLFSVILDDFIDKFCDKTAVFSSDEFMEE